MKNVVVLASLAGLASTALAGTPTGSLIIIPSATTVDSSATTSFTLAVYGDSSFGTHLFGGAFSMDATGGDGIVTGMSWTGAAWGLQGANDRGEGTGGDHLGVVFGYLIDPDFPALRPGTDFASGPVFIGSFQVDIAANTSGTVEWTGAVDSISEFVLNVFDENTSEFIRLLNDDFSDFGSASVNVEIPAPSSMALLGLGGLVAGRRRR